MKKTITTASGFVLLLMAVISVAPSAGRAAIPAAVSYVYTDSLASGWQNWSWGSSVNLQDSAYRRTGSYSASCAYTQAWGSLYFAYNAPGFNTTGYDTLLFYINGGTSSGQSMDLGLVDAQGNFLPAVDLEPYIEGGFVAANTWRAVTIPLAALQGANRAITGIVVQEGLGQAQPRYYIDDMQFMGSGGGSTPTAVVSATTTRTPTRTATPNPNVSSTPTTGGGGGGGGGIPWLKTQGNQLVTDPGGQAVTLRGANILRSEWVLNMSWERLAIPYLSQNWRGNVVLRGFAADPVNNNDPSYLALLDEERQLAEQNRMYIIYAFRSYEINGDQPEYPDSRATQALVKLAQRYYAKSNVMYALAVEPHNVSWETLRPLYEEMVDAIRAASSPYRPIIMASGTQWSRYVGWAIEDPVNRENVVYKSHPYDASSEFQSEFIEAYDAGLPIFIGEFGMGSTMTLQDVQELLSITRGRNIGWAAWLFDWQGPPVLLADSAFTPTQPYGTTVRDEMLTTPPLPAVNTTPTRTPISSPSSTRTATYTFTPTRTLTPVSTNTAVSTNTPRPTISSTAVNTPTSTRTPTGTSTSTLTRTATSTPTSTLAPTQESTPTATISPPINCNAVTWRSLVNVTASGNAIKKSGGANNSWNAGAISSREILSGDGYIQVSVDETSSQRAFGLSRGNSNARRSDIDFAVQVGSGSLRVFESGVSRGSFGAVATGDVIRVAVEEGVVKYYRNNSVVYTSAASPSYPLLLDTSIYTSGGRVSGAYLCARSVSP